MSKTEGENRMKQTAQTIHGEIEYQTLTCDSCGDEFLEDDAKEFVIGKGHHRDSDGEWVFKDKYKPTQGIACPICYEQGPADFPTKIHNGLKYHGLGNIPNDGGSFWPVALFAPLIMPIAMLAYVFTEDGEISEAGIGFAQAGWMLLFWTLFVAGILYLI